MTKSNSGPKELARTSCFNTIFFNVFFSNETTFYLDCSVDNLWLKNPEYIIHSKHKERKIGKWVAINTKI